MENRKTLSAFVKELLFAISEGNTKKMKEIGNDAIREAALSRDKETIRLAIICSSLSKVFSKEYYRKDEMRWKDFVIDLRNDLRRSLEEGTSLEKIEADISKLDSSVGRFVSQVTDHAVTKKASTLYAIGLSLGTASKLTGANEWDVLREVGKTRMFDEQALGKTTLSQRFKTAEKILGGD